MYGSAGARGEQELDEDTIREVLSLCHPHGVFEVRALGCGYYSSAYFGVFSDVSAAVQAIRKVEAAHQPRGIYFGLNPLVTDARALANNRMICARQGQGVTDQHVTKRQLLYLDFDPVRLAGIAATDEEHDQAHSAMARVEESLSALDWPPPLQIDSGNGGALLYRIDLPNDDGAKGLLKRLTDALSAKWSTDAVKIDTSVFNSSRIARLPGTWNRKGDEVEGRPHRRAEIMLAPRDFRRAHSVVSQEQLVALATPLSVSTVQKPAAGSQLDRDPVAATGAVERARRYLAKLPPAVDGDGGDKRTFRAACLLVIDFGLEIEQALPLLVEWNALCVPPWPPEKLDRKLVEAAKRPGVRGWRLTSETDPPRSDTSPVDLPLDERIDILLTTDEKQTNDAVLAALAASDQGLYQRGGKLVHIIREASVGDAIVRPAGAPHIATVAPPVLRENISAECRFLTAQSAKSGPRFKIVNTPRDSVFAIHTRGQWSGIRPLAGIVTSPCLRPDGTILTEPGYDAATGLWLEAGDHGVSVPDRPTQVEAAAAAGVLCDLVQDFPFAGYVHRATWLSALLTVLSRQAFDGPAPLFLVEANVRGSGKTLLAGLCSLIATGKAFSRFPAPEDDAECRKKITTVAIAGDPMVLLDNLETLGWPSLDAALTATHWSDRVLATNDAVNLPLATTWFGTGNNVIIAGDTARRIAHIRLESRLESPERRADFHIEDIAAYVRLHRGQYLSAALTILRGYFAAGRPDMRLAAWGSYEDWSRVVRNAVVWAGLDDPGAGREQMQGNADPDLAVLRQLLAAWPRIDRQGRGVTSSQILERCHEPDLSVLLAELCGPSSGGSMAHKL